MNMRQNDKEQDGPGKITWIPTVKNMLEDALLMIAIHVVKNKEICAMAKEFFKNQKSHWAEVYDDITPESLAMLYEKSRALKNSYKIVLTVLEGSTIMGQIEVLEHYNMDVEVCTPRYSRYYSDWGKEVVVRGSLKINE